MVKTILGALLGAILFASHGAAADPADAAREVYRQFAAAQNARDLEQVRTLLLNSPTFLWVSDGKSIWGRDAVLRRMALFQEARVWRVDPDLDRSVAVPVGADAAFLHLPLQLNLAFTSAEPEQLHFLVSVLCVETAQGWRIAALFTTTENDR
ncbi:MAG TPA: nuclear transport factor 2 family protein [Stellaceae bacterium]|nr:nuclear transport factor 2 family protein [Stellaceae bacterium]